MTSVAIPVQCIKRVDSTKKSPLKVVSPIIKKYTGHRQGKIKKKIKFPRVLHGGHTKQKKQLKPQLKSILPKTDGGNIIILESDLLPCALNPHKRKKREDDSKSSNDNFSEQMIKGSIKLPENSHIKEDGSKPYKSKLLLNSKKKLKCLKNVEASVELLEADTSALKEKQEQAFVENYLTRVQQRLKEKDESIYNQFVDLLSSFQANGISVCELYKKIKSLFNSHTDLIEDFVVFLTPEQAIKCGVFMDYLLLTSMSDFLNMVDIYFAKSPQQIKKIHSVLESLATKPNITTESVLQMVLPLLKGNTVLKDYFMHLIPNVRPPENFCSDYEEMDYSELNSDMSDDEELMETVRLPEMEDSYGGDSCPCKCHEDNARDARGPHCITCSLKFINGKVFIQNGKFLRPARVVFHDYDMNFHRDRLAPKLYPKRNKKKHRSALFKDNLSPTKSCNLSSDEFKSDIEEDEKGRMKLVALMKSPKTNRKKSVSPKHCEKLSTKLNPERGREVPADEDKAWSAKCSDTGSLKEDLKSKGAKTDKGSSMQTNFEFLIFSADGLNQEPVPLKSKNPEKPLDLPQIVLDGESREEMVSVANVGSSDLTATEENPIKTQSSGFVDKGSLSPPVISIPETSNPMFPESKPILSLFEILDETKDLSGVDGYRSKQVQGNQSSPDALTSVSQVKEEIKKEGSTPWKIEEDRVILQTLQVEDDSEETFVKIGKNIPTRSVDDIKKRFEELMNIFYEMKAKTGNG